MVNIGSLSQFKFIRILCFLKILIPQVLIYFIRSQVTKRQRIIHTYGIDDEVDLDEDTALAAVCQRRSATRQESATREASRQSTQTKTCVCGGKDHMHRSSSLPTRQPS